MSEFDNPFADPEAQNLFRDPSIQQAARSQATRQVLNDFNPFADQLPNYGSQLQTNARGSATMAATSPQPAVLEPLDQNLSKQPTWEEEDLRRKKVELDRRDEELRMREEQLQRTVGYEARRNNFPPFPTRCPIQPCFYQDFTVDIPGEFQKITKMVYYLWIGYVFVLLLNFVGSLAYFISSSQHDMNNHSGTTFGLSILYCFLFIPCSFVCWYRPLYKAFRDDSSFNFFVFFFIFFFQFCVTILQCLGISGWGTVGLISSIEMFAARQGGTVAAGLIMIAVGALFGASAVGDAIALIRVHRIFRSSGASFAKAQEEFARGVMSNSTMQQTAGNVAASAARTTVQQTWSSN